MSVHLLLWPKCSFFSLHYMMAFLKCKKDSDSLIVFVVWFFFSKYNGCVKSNNSFLLYLINSILLMARINQFFYHTKFLF